MATAGFSHGFLGFNFGKKDEEKKGGDPLLRVYSEAKEAHTQQDFKKAELRYHDALRVLLHISQDFSIRYHGTLSLTVIVMLHT